MPCIRCTLYQNFNPQFFSSNCSVTAWGKHNSIFNSSDRCAQQSPWRCWKGRPQQPPAIQSLQDHGGRWVKGEPSKHFPGVSCFCFWMQPWASDALALPLLGVVDSFSPKSLNSGSERNPKHFPNSIFGFWRGAHFFFGIITFLHSVSAFLRRLQLVWGSRTWRGSGSPSGSGAAAFPISRKMTMARRAVASWRTATCGGWRRRRCSSMPWEVCHIAPNTDGQKSFGDIFKFWMHSSTHVHFMLSSNLGHVYRSLHMSQNWDANLSCPTGGLEVFFWQYVSSLLPTAHWSFSSKSKIMLSVKAQSATQRCTWEIVARVSVPLEDLWLNLGCGITGVSSRSSTSLSRVVWSPHMPSNMFLDSKTKRVF